MATKYKSDLGGTYVDSVIYNSWMEKARAFLKLFLEDDNEFLIGYIKLNAVQRAIVIYYVRCDNNVKDGKSFYGKGAENFFQRRDG